jgi:hypothetical protein
MPLAEYQSLVIALVRDTSEVITDADRDNAIALAVTRYSEDKPRTVKADITSDGTNFLALPEAWDDSFSRIVKIEYPIGKAPPVYLTEDSFDLYDGLDTTQLMLINALPSGQVARMSLTARHLLDDETDTITGKDKEAVVNWAAGILLQQLANYYSGTGNSTIQADTVDWQTRGAEFANRAKACRQFYFDQLGVDPKKNRAAGAVASFEGKLSSGQPRIIHRVRRA